jgi:hypothetical protein
MPEIEKTAGSPMTYQKAENPRSPGNKRYFLQQHSPSVTSDRVVEQ